MRISLSNVAFRAPFCFTWHLRASRLEEKIYFLIFWSEIPDQQARQRLRENLSRLRKDLPDPTLLITDNHNISLDFSRVNVDLLAFDRLVETAGRTPWQFPKTELLPEHTYQTLVDAMECWHGSQFLTGARLVDNLFLDNLKLFLEFHDPIYHAASI